MASIPPPTPVKKEEITKESSFVMKEVDSHGLGSHLVLTDGFKCPAVGGLIRSTIRAIHRAARPNTAKILGKPGMLLRP